MPNPSTHIDLVYQASQRITHPVLDSYMGYLLLGATSPDIRAITHDKREKYHFADLNFVDVGSGLKNLFATHPELLNTSTLDGPTTAFVAGYISHLVLDESWTAKMYRPWFGNNTVFKDPTYGRVMDRAMQIELDRRSRGNMQYILPILAQTLGDVNIHFISNVDLKIWHRWVLHLVKKEFSWDRLNFMAKRIAAGDETHPSYSIAREFLKDFPNSLEQLYKTVPSKHLSNFREESVTQISEVIMEYLT